MMVICCLIITMTGAWGCKTVVTERPAEPVAVVVRPAQPGSNYIWIDGDWYSSSGKYYRREGHWVVVKPGRNWENGHWIKGRRGWYWVGGHWR